LTSPALETEQPLASPAASPLITKPPKGLLASAIVVFGKANNSAINLSDIANANNPTGGFVINGEVAGDRSGHADDL
jgi:Neuraminidase (sialidase)